MRTGLFAAAATIAILIAPAAARGGPVTDPATGHVYERLTDAVTWNEARALAELRTFNGMRGHLATLATAAESDFVWQSLGEPVEYFIGLSDTGAEGTFAWVTGEPLTFTNWRNGEPNNAFGVEHGVELTHFGKWNDIDNANLVRAGYIVEYEGPTTGDLEGAIADLMEQLDAANATIAEQEETIAALESDLAATTAALDGAVGTIAMRDAEIVRLEGERAAARATIAERDREITALLGQLAAANATIADQTNMIAARDFDLNEIVRLLGLKWSDLKNQTNNGQTDAGRQAIDMILRNKSKK